MNPLRNVCGPNFTSLVENYRPPSGTLEDALSHLTNFLPTQGTTALTDDEKDMKSIVPNMSRSVIVHLCKRENRSKRALRETVGQIPEEAFSKLFLGKSSKNMLLALMTCFQREKGEEGTESSSERFSVPQTPYDAKVFKMTKSVLGESGMKSRSDLTKMAVDWLNPENHNLSPLRYRMHDVPKYNFSMDVKLVSEMISEAEEAESNCHIKGFTPNNRHLHTERFKFLFTPPGFLSQALQDFDMTNKPKTLGGASDISSSLYLETREIYSQKLRQLIERSQVFKMVLMESDLGKLNFPQSIIVSSSFANMRTVCEFKNVKGKIKIEDNLRFFPSLIGFKPNKSGVDVSLTSPAFNRMVRDGSVKRIDITDLVNASMRTHDIMAFNDNRTKTQIWALLASLKLPLIVCPTQLRFPTIQERFNTLDGTHVTNSYRLNEQDLPGSEVLVEKNGHYDHYHTIISKADLVTEEDGPKDKHFVSLMRNIKSLEVTVQNFKGVISLMSGKHVIRGLCSNHFETKSVVTIKTRAVFSQNLVEQYDLLGASKLLSPIDFELHRPVEDVEVKVSEEVDNEEDKFFEVQESLLSDEELLGDELFSSDSESEDSINSETKSDASEEDKILDLGHIDHVGSEVSHQSSARATPNLGLIFAGSSASMKNMQRGLWVYELKLPFVHPKAIYEDTGEGTATELLLKDLHDNSLDSQWKVGFIVEVLRLSGVFHAERRMWQKAQF